LKILCIACGGTGHLDFGGLGFVRLARKLVALGHEVIWISSQKQVERLRAFGFAAEQQPVVDALSLNHFIPANAISVQAGNYLQLLQRLHYFRALIRSRKPGLILFDRLLAYAAMAADDAGIPYVSVGTPGGYWRLSKSGTLPSTVPVQEYRDLGSAIKSDLRWEKGSLDSFWINSPLLNICFVGKDFYATPPEVPSATVHHFAERPIQVAGTRFGVSFGNSGHEPILKSFTKCLIRHKGVREPIDIFLGNKEQLLRELQAKYQSEQIRLHGWVDFSRHFPELKCLAFFGGIGTVWHCLDNFLPMLVVPGMVGDQRYNGHIISQLRLGECFLVNENVCESLRPVLARFTGAQELYKEKIAALRSRDRYSDTLETIGDRLMRL
jgi:hypothetical protein